MSWTCYCKKCAQDVPVGDHCPHCGGKLSPNAARVAWCVEHIPAKDWMCWNAAMRLILPAAAMALALILLLEGISGGEAAVLRLLQGSLPVSLLALLAFVSLVLLLIFILQGHDLVDCVLDKSGVHVLVYLPDPTPLKLILRLRSPALMNQLDPADESPVLLISQKEIAWRAVSRVQLWSEKTMILFYAPAWWMRAAVCCSPFTYEDALRYVSEKLGRKKSVLLPQELVAPPKPKAPRKLQPQQIAMDDLPAAEQPEDFVPLADVLTELQEAAAADEADPALPDEAPADE